MRRDTLSSVLCLLPAAASLLGSAPATAAEPRPPGEAAAPPLLELPDPLSQEMGQLLTEGVTAAKTGELRAAERAFRAGLEKATASDNPRWIGRFRARLGDIYDSLRRHEQALEQYRQALAIHGALGERHNIAIDLNNLGVVYARLGQFDQALEHLSCAFALREALGSSGHPA